MQRNHILRTVVAMALMVVFAWGCAATQPELKSADLLTTPNLMLEADTAWKNRQFKAAELYYTKLLERQDVPEADMPGIYSRLAEAAFANEHYHQARLALQDWANLDTGALGSAQWESLYFKTLSALGKSRELRNHLEWVLNNHKLPWETRQNVAIWAGEYFQAKGDAEMALRVLDLFYDQAPDMQARVAFEHTYLDKLQVMEPATIIELSKAVTTDNQWRFPYVLVGFERSAAEASDADTWSVTWRTLTNLVANADLADPIPLEGRLAELESKYGLPRIGLAMALPLTGPYGKVGVKILRGAGLAQWRLAQDGTDIDMRVINTAVPGWDKRLAALPPHYTVVGGPLRVSAFKKLYQGDEPGERIVDERAFFAFLSSLGDLTEGQDAWRFFTSRNDEVRSLVKLAVDELGIKDLAVFYPEEKFGRTMAQDFYREAAPLGGRIRGMQSYPSRDLKQWGKRIARLLNVPSDFSENKDVPLEQPDFGAVFLPDGWRQAQTLLPNFFFYEGDQLVFLGPGLWSRALNNAKDIDEHYYRLAVCPGAWWERSQGGQALQAVLTEEGLGRADFWVALGHDFVKFVGKFGTLPTKWSPQDVNNRLASAQQIDFSMAPMTWNEQGVASQELFLFSPVRNGKTLVNADKVTARVARAKARREKRVEAYEKRLEEEEAKKKESMF